MQAISNKIIKTKGELCMCKIKIDLDSYKDFFSSEYGLKLIHEIVDNGDYEAIKGLVKWKHCTSKVLDRIALKFMVHDNIKENMEMLEDVAEHPRVSKKTLSRLFEFASSMLSEHRYLAEEVLEEIAESKKLSEDMAWKLYSLAVSNALFDVIDELAENDKTPDEVIFAILERYKEDSKQYRKACKQVVKRYKKLREQLKKEENK